MEKYENIINVNLLANIDLLKTLENLISKNTKIILEKRFEKTSLESILETIKNIISLKEKRFEIDL